MHVLILPYFGVNWKLWSQLLKANPSVFFFSSGPIAVSYALCPALLCSPRQGLCLAQRSSVFGG